PGLVPGVGIAHAQHDGGVGELRRELAVEQAGREVDAGLVGGEEPLPVHRSAAEGEGVPGVDVALVRAGAHADDLRHVVAGVEAEPLERGLEAHRARPAETRADHPQRHASPSRARAPPRGAPRPPAATLPDRWNAPHAGGRLPVSDMGPLRFRCAAALLVLVAVGVRSLEWAPVFPGDGSVWLLPFDGAYHARRALYTFERFPSLLRLDPYLAYLGGAVVPAPPLWDWALGATARALGKSVATFERVAAWASPALAGLCVLPIAAAGRAVAGAALGLGGAAIFALLPVAANFARLGSPDHH